MNASETVRLYPSSRAQNELRLMADRVSRLWNSANYILRQRFVTNEGIPTGAALEKLAKSTPEYRQLPSDVAQETLKKLSEAWRSYFALRKNWSSKPAGSQKPGLPAYRKDRKTGKRPCDLIPLKCSRAYSLDPKDAHVVLPRDRRPKGGSSRLHIAYRGRRRFMGKYGRAEIRWDRTRKRWYMSWSVQTAAPAPMSDGRAAAVDLGARVSASLSIEGVVRALHFEGRELLKDWDYFGQTIAREQSHIAGTRGSVRGNRVPTSRAILLLYLKRRLRLEHGQKVMAKQIAETCRDQGVSTVYLGWPKSILRDVKYRSSMWAGRIHTFWSFGRMLGFLENALRKVEIVAVRVGERGSSSCCPTCGSAEVVRHPRWTLRCTSCGERMHSDQAGSRNILRQNKPSVSWAGAEAAPRTGTRRWNRHAWVERSANPRGFGENRPEFLTAA